jgi:hypothetical protein
MAPPLLSQRAAGNFRQDARRLGRPRRGAVGRADLAAPARKTPLRQYVRRLLARCRRLAGIGDPIISDGKASETGGPRLVDGASLRMLNYWGEAKP